MVSSVRNLLVLTILAVLASTGYAIHCYMCESLTNPKCGQKFEADSSFLLDCSRIAPPRHLNFLIGRNATGCMKKTLEGVPGHPQFVRSCFFGDIRNAHDGCTPDPATPFVKQLSCEVCDKNECNSSGSLTPIAGAIILFFGVARLLA
ncbi:hypothetical protein ACLKA7_003621 [Drosophila subpalustris]